MHRVPALSHPLESEVVPRSGRTSRLAAGCDGRRHAPRAFEQEIQEHLHSRTLRGT